MKPILVWLPEGVIEQLDRLVKTGLYPNRNEAIRMALRDLIHSEAVLPQSGNTRYRHLRR